jgi:predicted GIY-YIG superfamily endonuclease
MQQHFSGRGSAATRSAKPVSVNHIHACRSVSSAKKAESIIYSKMSAYHGKSKVRGAGHTKRF